MTDRPTGVRPPGRRRAPGRGLRRGLHGALHRGLGGASAAALLALAASILTAAPALAHDQLLSTTPEAGSTVTTSPTEVSLDFSGNLISGQGIQNLVTVTDEAGHQWQDGDAQVAGPALTSALCEGMPNGDYEVDYRVVYSDGHSEAKQYGFTLDDPAAPETAAPRDCGVPNPDAPVSSDQDPTSAGAGSTDATTGATSGTEPLPATAPASGASDPAGTPTTEATTGATGIASDVPTWVWVVGVLGVLIVAAAVVFVFRRARDIDRPDIDGPAIGGPDGGRTDSED